MARTPGRGDIIAALNQLKREGVITSFQTTLFERDGQGGPQITVTVADPSSPGEALRQVRQALEPIGADLIVQLDLRPVDRR